MNFKFEEEVMYGDRKATVRGFIPAFMQVGHFPKGIDDIDIRYLEMDFDKGIIGIDTVLIQVEDVLIRVALNAIKKIEVKKVKLTEVKLEEKSKPKKKAKKKEDK